MEGHQSTVTVMASRAFCNHVQMDFLWEVGLLDSGGESEARICRRGSAFNLIVTYDSIPVWILWEWIGAKGHSMNN